MQIITRGRLKDRWKKERLTEKQIDGEIERRY